MPRGWRRERTSTASARTASGWSSCRRSCWRRAALVAVDAREAARAEAGDVVAAIERGLVAEDRLVEIGSIGPDWVATRPADAITVFKSVGLAVQDVAAAELITDRLLGSARED